MKLWDLSNNQPSCVSSLNPKLVRTLTEFHPFSICKRKELLQCGAIFCSRELYHVAHPSVLLFPGSYILGVVFERQPLPVGVWRIERQTEGKHHGLGIRGLSKLPCVALPLTDTLFVCLAGLEHAVGTRRREQIWEGAAKCTSSAKRIPHRMMGSSCFWLCVRIDFSDQFCYWVKCNGSMDLFICTTKRQQKWDM